MKKLNISIEDLNYLVVVADTDSLRKQGLMGIQKLPTNKGMLFDFESEGNHEMWMKDTLIPLLQIFINSDKEVIKTVSREPNDETLIGCDGTKYVLEVNPTNEIEVGDLMEMEGEEDDAKGPVMKVLAPDGSVQGEIHSGLRIFSRKNTRILLKQAKKAFENKTDSDYKRLGKSIFKYLNIQDNRKPEYVTLPSSKKDSSDK